ncbi:glycosyltransferase family 4 protein [Dehalobacter sp. TeCB1]|uniref:glycosyltransferase family 4 protein n=1 Tax=Dehalobacter sp. TeCB1 TaxID=1843715 RepID=UPI00083A5486|nr:glycosyltransferase family 4 protein [Dehalobacter sp. TeCB1]OCZ49431.1 hypothetical protein A7D23_02960 [Dehalobacter sp. TeCB1]
MNILIVSDVYIPNANSSAVLLRDLALSLKKKEINVYVLTLRENNTNVEKDTPVTEENGVKVLRVNNLKKKNVGMIRRGLSEVMLPYLLYRSYRKYLRNIKPDVIICYSPPITLERTIRRLRKKYGSRVYLVLRDVFPQCAMDVGVLKQEFIFDYFKKIEKQLYRVSNFIGVQSQSDLMSIRNHQWIDKEKVELLYNWIDISPYGKEINRDFRSEFGVGDKIVCIYAGNIGKYQELSFLFELTKLNRDREDVIFLIVGSGSESRELRETYKNFKNVMFKEFIDPKYYPDLVRQCDIGLINLNRNLTVQNIPGKLMGYWCSKLPVLASVNSGNDLLMMMKVANGGFCSVTGDLESYNQNFNRLCSDKELRKEMGISGHQFALEHFSADKARDNILRHFGEEGNV